MNYRQIRNIYSFYHCGVYHLPRLDTSSTVLMANLLDLEAHRVDISPKSSPLQTNRI